MLDVAMPEMNGHDVFDYIHQENLQIAVIYLSAYGDIAMAVKAIKNGAVDFLTKPFNAMDLIKAIEEAIRRTKNIRARQKEMNDFRHRLNTLRRRKRPFFL